MSILDERNSVSNSKEVEKNLICLGNRVSLWLESRICAKSSRKETKNMNCSEMGGAGFWHESREKWNWHLALMDAKDLDMTPYQIK